MTDREKIINNFEHEVNKAHGESWDFVDLSTDDAKEILALLKAQEPREPKVDVDEWRCWNCGHELEHQELLGENVLFHEQYSYCPQCGMAVKWDG